VCPTLFFSATLLPSVKRFLPEEWNNNEIVWRAPYFHSLSVEFTKSQVVASVPGFFFCVWYAMKKHWLANNVLGIAFCIQGIEMLSLGSFKTGGILLVCGPSNSVMNWNLCIHIFLVVLVNTFHYLSHPHMFLFFTSLLL
jgi:hypothetical protein